MSCSSSQRSDTSEARTCGLLVSTAEPLRSRISKYKAEYYVPLVFSEKDRGQKIMADPRDLPFFMAAVVLMNAR